MLTSISHSLLSRVEWPSARVSDSHRHTHAETLPSRLTRYRGGTYSSTVDQIVFTDGSSARTDLIRLNPNIAAYSLDIGGIAPSRPSPYRVDGWLAAVNLRARTRESQVAWMLANSYPSISTAKLSRRMRAAGYLGDADIKDHEAIAGTQAAIWYLTNGVVLDTAARNVPIATRESPSFIEFEFDGQPQLGGFTVRTGAAQAAASVRLHASVDGSLWREVSSSELSLDGGAASYVKALGVGATVAEIRHGAPGLGYRFFRLYVQGSGARDVEKVDFWLHDARNYRNADRVVQLYRYLLAQSHLAMRQVDIAPKIDDSEAVMAAGLVGPLTVKSAGPVRLSVAHGRVMDISGAELTGLVAPGTRFYLHPADGAQTATVSLSDPEALAPVLVGVAENGLTPLALVVPGARQRDVFTIDWLQTTQLSQVS